MHPVLILLVNLELPSPQVFPHPEYLLLHVFLLHLHLLDLLVTLGQCLLVEGDLPPLLPLIVLYDVELVLLEYLVVVLELIQLLLLTLVPPLSIVRLLLQRSVLYF